MIFDRVYLEITDICNQSCSFCPGCSREKQFIAPEKFRAYAKEIREYTDCLCLHVMGEPTLHPQLDALLQITDELDYRVMLTTNGTLLKQREEILLSHKSMYKISISLHSFEANEKKQEGYFDTCIDFAVRSAEKGIITVLRLWNLDGIVKGENEQNGEIYEYIKRRINGCWRKSSRGFCILPKLYLQYDQRFVWPDEHGRILQENGFCRALRNQIAVLCDGSVVPCCLDGQGKMILGNLNAMSFSEILSSDLTVSMARGFSEGKFLQPLCQTCGYALRFCKGKNREEWQRKGSIHITE